MMHPPVCDQYGNTWRLLETGAIEVHAADTPSTWRSVAGPADEQTGKWQTIQADAEGFVWLSDGRRWFRHDPRQAARGWAEAEPPRKAGGNSWRQAASLPCGNHDIFATEHGGLLYIAGGLTHYRGYPPQNHVFDELYTYDIAEDAWHIVSRMPHPRCYNGIATLDDRIWIVGGAANLTEPDNPDGPRTPLDTVVIYDPAADLWSDGPSLHTARIEPVVATLMGRIYAIGGADERDITLASAESIGPGESSWRMEAPVPVPMRQAAGCVLNDRLYVCGKSGFFAYDPGAQVWEELPPVPTGLPQAPLVAAHKKAVWVIGGYKTNAVWRYKPEGRRWYEAPELPTPQSWGAAWSLKDRLMVIGGAHWSEAHEVFIFDDRVFVLQEP